MAESLEDKTKGRLVRVVDDQVLMEGSISEIAAAMKAIRKCYIETYETSDEGTFSILKTGAGFECHIGEPPWRRNERGFSCIPSGIYECALVDSEKFGTVYGVSVPGRDFILIHAGNYCGDTTKKFKSDTEGCLMPGRAIVKMAGQLAVRSSKDALAAFMAEMDGEDFLLIVNRHKVIGENP